MKLSLSKERAKRAKSREKKAGKTSLEKLSIKEKPLIGLLIAFLLWVAVSVIMGLEHIIAHTNNPDILLPLTGNSAFLLISLFAVALCLKITDPKTLHSNPMILMLSLVTLISLVPAKGLIYMAQTTNWISWETTLFLLPFAFAALIVTILANPTTAILIGIWTSLAIAFMAEKSLPLFITGMTASVVAAKTGEGIKNRHKIIRVGIIVGLFQTVCVFGFTALNWSRPDMRMILFDASACLISGFISAIMVVIFLPIFEALFGVTTNIKLQELADPSHPLLQRLAIEAPGTYHHSLVVANLAQAAADEIGANSLLARVSAYFHDVGKLTKPDFFVENIQLQSNPHDDLLPSMSTLVITAHVKEGLSLAILHKLPEPIKKAIREHHGTSLLSYFHHKAQSQLELELSQENGTQPDGVKKLDEGTFRYPGPKPSTPESAIICMADACEAASRTMKKTTPGHVENLINDIVNTRFEDGQLDNCDITLKQLSKIKRSFVFTLTNMLHGRIPYPEDENRDKQLSKNTSNKQTEDKESSPASNGSSQKT